MLGRIIYI